MAVIFSENYAKYPTGAFTSVTADNPEYICPSTSNLTITAAYSRDGSYNGLAVDFQGRDVTVPFTASGGGATGPTAIVSFGYKWHLGSNIGAMEILSFPTTGTGTAYHGTVEVWAGGLRVKNANGTIVASAHGPWFCSEVYHLVEVKINCSNTGSLIVRIDGAEVINVSSDFLNGASASPPEYVRFHDGMRYYVTDHFLVLDTTGSVMNNFPGDYRFEYKVADADGATAAWTNVGGGSNYQNVDDALTAYDDDTTYITSSTVNQDNYISAGAFSLTNLNAVLFVHHEALARNDGSGSIALLTNSGGTVSATADKTLSTAYKWVHKFDAVDPNTSAAWASAAAINSAEWGVRYR